MFSIKKILIFLLLLILYCSVVNATVSVTQTCNADNIIMRISDPEDAHGSKWDDTNYNNYVCDSDAGTHECNGNNIVLKLGEETDSHAYSPTLSINGYNVCYGDYVNCNVNSQGCSEDSFCVVKLSDNEDSHIYPCTSDEVSVSVCCSKTETPTTPTNNNRRSHSRINDSSTTENLTIELNPEQPVTEQLNSNNPDESNNDIVALEQDNTLPIENKSRLPIYIGSGIAGFSILFGAIYYFMFRNKP